MPENIVEPYYKNHYRQIGKTKNGEAIFKEGDTGDICIKKDFDKLVIATRRDLKGAEFWG